MRSFGKHYSIRDWLGLLYIAVVLASSACTVQAPRTPAAGGSAGGASASGGINRPEHRGKSHLVLISFDGLRHDYLERFNLPNFKRMSDRGARRRR